MKHGSIMHPSDIIDNDTGLEIYSFFRTSTTP